jgi:hypothetical protein
MAKVTICADIKPAKQKFKKGDLVTLLDGRHSDEKYKNRPMIVSEAESLGYFKAFCLINNEVYDRCASSQFEISTKAIMLSN